MLNHQQLSYRRYYRMLPDGETLACTRRECFAPGEEPTADNPLKQRWYYSPDGEMAIRLPRNPLGEETHKANAADLKAQERTLEKPTLCIGRIAAASCPVTCADCTYRDSCSSVCRAKGREGCKRKCSGCALYTRHTVELDKPITDTDDSAGLSLELPDDADNSADALYKKERLALILVAVSKLPVEMRELWDALLCGKSKVQIAREQSVTEGAIRKRVLKLGAMLGEWLDIKDFLD